MDRIRLKPINAAKVLLTCIGLHNLLINLGNGYYTDVELMQDDQSADPYDESN